VFAAHDLKTLTNSVHGKLSGVAVPFLGLDKTDACGQIYLADGKTKVGCPLKAGTEYVYLSKMPILEMYPKVRMFTIFESFNNLPITVPYQWLEISITITL